MIKEQEHPVSFTPYLPKVVAALDAAVHVEELVEVEEDARHVGDEEHADDAHQNHAQLQILRLQKKMKEKKKET